jgi:hypothetical protein
MVKIISYDAIRAVKYWSESEYDENGNMVKTTYCDTESIRWCEYEYALR